jgi:hypothetical protein
MPLCAPHVDLLPSLGGLLEHSIKAWRAALSTCCNQRMPPFMQGSLGAQFLFAFEWSPSPHPATPPLTSLQMFTRRAAASIYSNQRLQRWCFDVELIYLAQRLGVPIAEVQVRRSLLTDCVQLLGT